jgi:hypothetical protein
MHINKIEMEAKYPNLDYLLGGYFTLDWDCDYADPEAVIRNFIIDRGMKEVEQVIMELKTLLNQKYTLQEWESIVYDIFDCEYYFDYEKQYSPKEWLEKVLEQLEGALLLSSKQEKHSDKKL